MRLQSLNTQPEIPQLRLLQVCLTQPNPTDTPPEAAHQENRTCLP